MSKIPKSTSLRKRFPLGLFIAVFALSNFFTPIIIEGLAESSLAYSCILVAFIGAIVAQLCLFSIWAVFGPLRLLSRLPVTLFLTELSAAFLTLGYLVVAPLSETFADIASTFLLLPLAFLATQLPLWGLKLVTGGRIVHVAADPRPSTTPRRQFGLRDVMGGTVVMAVALSLASSGMKISEDLAAEGWIPILAACLACTVVSTLATLPCLWAGMIAKNKGAATGIVAIYTMLISVLCVVGIGLLLLRGTMPWEVLVMLFAYSGTLMAVILGTLRIARLCGYVYISGGRPQPDHQAGCPSAVQHDSSGGTQPAKPLAPGADEPPDSTGPSA